MRSFAQRELFLHGQVTLAGQRAAVVMRLVKSAKLNGPEPWAYLRDVLARTHSHPRHRLG